VIPRRRCVDGIVQVSGRARLRFVSAGLGEAGSETVVRFFGGDRGEVVDGFVGSFGVEPGDPVQDGGFEVVAVDLAYRVACASAAVTIARRAATCC
jgi:hypothetical protein